MSLLPASLERVSRFLLFCTAPMDQAVLLFVVGLALTAAMSAKALLEHVRLPALVGYICIGILLRGVTDYAGVLGPGARRALELFADIGLVCLLFRVGLESNLRGLLRQFGRAVPIWFGNVAVSFALGLMAVRYFLQGDWLTALFLGTALSATSVGVSIAVWRDVGALGSAAGELLLDIAELDDLSAIFLMSILLALVSEPLPDAVARLETVVVWQAAGWVLLKAAVLCLFCLVFAYRVEPGVTSFFLRHERPPDPALAIFGIGIAIAGAAAALGFSVAVGAFFAGLVFSRDPEALKSESSIEPFYEAFVPFFFLGLGFQMVPTGLASAVAPAFLLLAVAVIGKLVGVALPGLPLLGRSETGSLAVSMVPRAEIAMVVVLSGFERGVVPANLYNAMVLVTAATCLATPVALRFVLCRTDGTSTSEPASLAAEAILKNRHGKE